MQDRCYTRKLFLSNIYVCHYVSIDVQRWTLHHIEEKWTIFEFLILVHFYITHILRRSKDNGREKCMELRNSFSKWYSMILKMISCRITVWKLKEMQNQKNLRLLVTRCFSNNLSQLFSVFSVHKKKFMSGKMSTDKFLELIYPNPMMTEQMY